MLTYIVYLVKQAGELEKLKNEKNGLIISHLQETSGHVLMTMKSCFV